MRNALPPFGKLSKEAKVTVQECVSEFISFVTSQAAEKCSIEKRKTLNGEDILSSMHGLGFENYAETLKIYLTKYREFEQRQNEAKKCSIKPKRQYHRKNLKNRPKTSSRPSSLSTGQHITSHQHNLPTLVPTSLLTVSDHTIPPPPSQPQYTLQLNDKFEDATSFKVSGISPKSDIHDPSGYYTYSAQVPSIHESVDKPDSSGPVEGQENADSSNSRESTESKSESSFVYYGDFMNL